QQLDPFSQSGAVTESRAATNASGAAAAEVLGAQGFWIRFRRRDSPKLGHDHSPSAGLEPSDPHLLRRGAAQDRGSTIDDRCAGLSFSASDYENNPKKYIPALSDGAPEAHLSNLERGGAR